MKRFAVKPIGVPAVKPAPERDAAAEVEAFLDALPAAWAEEPGPDVTMADSPWWICLVFQTKEQKLEFLRGAGFDPRQDQHADGIAFAEAVEGRRSRGIRPAARRFAVTKLGTKPASPKPAKSEYQQRAQAERERFALAVDVNYWVAFCFPSAEERDACTAKIADVRGVFFPGARTQWFFDGLAVAAHLGITIAAPSPEWGEPRIKTRWQRYVG